MESWKASHFAVEGKVRQLEAHYQGLLVLTDEKNKILQKLARHTHVSLQKMSSLDDLPSVRGAINTLLEEMDHILVTRGQLPSEKEGVASEDVPAVPSPVQSL